MVTIEGVNESLVAAILLLFEDEKKSGGGEIEKHEYDNESNVLTIYYENQEIAKRVLDHSGVNYKNTVYKAKPALVKQQHHDSLKGINY